MSSSKIILVLVAYFAVVFGEICSKPEITSTSFTTQDATIVLKIAYVSDITVKCANGKIGSLYAEVAGVVIPASAVGENRYQISWTEEIKSARSGEKLIRLFDEDGNAALRKAARGGEDSSTVPSLADISVYHPGAYNGPWLKSELLATIVSLVVSYFAITFRLKVTA